MTKYIITILFMILSFQLTAQDKSFMHATEDFEDGNYVSAIKHYKKALKSNHDLQTRKTIITQIAHSLYRINAYEEALPWFEQTYTDPQAKEDVILEYGNSLLHLKKYDDAKAVFDKGLHNYPNNKAIKNKLHLCQFYLEPNQTAKSRIQVENVHSLNSPYSDFAPAWFENNLVVTSSRITNANTKIDGRTNQAYSELYISVYDPNSDSWGNPHPAPKNINHLFNDGVFTYDELNAVAYFMRCNSKTKSSCKIFETQYSFDGNWSNPVELPFMEAEFDYGHPTVTNDGSTLYFVSNMPGGFGGKDIWKISRIEDNQWGIPVNLGPAINSEFDDLFPFVMGDSVLFFASERNTGYGGLDVYAAFQEYGQYSEAVILPLPVNSVADDFSLIIKRNTIGGLMSSNRENSLNSDDIYSFNKFPLTITYQGKVMDQDSKRPIEKVQLVFNNKEYQSDTIYTNSLGEFTCEIPAYLEYQVQIGKKNFITEFDQLSFYNKDIIYSDNRIVKKDFKLSTSKQSVALSGKVTERGSKTPIAGQQITMIASYGRIDTTYTDKKGHYNYSGLKPGANYTVRIAREGYFSESRKCDIAIKTKVTTYTKSTGYDMDFELTQIQEKEEILINNIFYDFDKASLRWESRKELDKIASMLLETPGVKIQINSHTDDRGKSEYNDRLSSERAQSVVDYLIAKGISSNRLLSKGYGKRKLLIRHARTEDDHQLNRRTSFNVLSFDKAQVSEENSTETYLSKDPTAGVSGLSFRLQLLASSQNYNTNDKFALLLKSLPDVEIYVQHIGKIFRYELGQRKTLTEIRILKQQLNGLGYKDCFIKAYYNNEKISLEEAKKLMSL
ncbi:MAG: OmpA family protein [Bacteroidales bacterium]|nr:OmpA family protein [Bacteroidales bacterium]